MSKQNQNYLLSKTGLGQVKKGFHELPNSQHIYGKAPTKDKYGARQVIGNWDIGQRSDPQQGGKDYISMNREGVKKGCIDSKQLSNFHKSNEIKLKIKQGQKFYGVKIPDEQFTYGVPNRPSTPMKNVICNTYAADELKLKEERQAVLKMLENDGKKRSPPKFQLSPNSKQIELNRKKQVEDNNFKLSKFKNVPSKIKPLIDASKKNHNNERV